MENSFGYFESKNKSQNDCYWSDEELNSSPQLDFVSIIFVEFPAKYLLLSLYAVTSDKHLQSTTSNRLSSISHFQSTNQSSNTGFESCRMFTTCTFVTLPTLETKSRTKGQIKDIKGMCLKERFIDLEYKHIEIMALQIST